jgi:hypothetical protein
VKNARLTLTIIIASLTVMLAGIAFLARAYGIAAIHPDADHYQSVLSLLLQAVAGRGWFYYLAIGSVLLVLIFSANTAFAGFPRVCRVIGNDYFLPLSFANRGRRLVYSEGVIVLAILTAMLLIFFDGVTDRLIPLYAVGAFLAFTLSQAGMVVHWKRTRGRGSAGNMTINAVGATATGLTLLVVVVAKFTEGAWITVVTIPALLWFMYSVRRHYDRVRREIASPKPLDLHHLSPPLVVIPAPDWSRVTKEALCAAFEISRDIQVLHVTEEGNEEGDEFCRKWDELVAQPAAQANLPPPELIRLVTPYRFVISPIVDYVIQLAEAHPTRRVVTIVPELVERHWYGYFMHTQRAALLKATLLMKGKNRISVLNIPWYLK